MDNINYHMEMFVFYHFTVKAFVSKNCMIIDLHDIWSILAYMYLLEGVVWKYCQHLDLWKVNKFPIL